MSRARDLAFRYFADALQPGEREEFLRMLQEDPEARRILARESALAAGMQDWAREQLEKTPVRRRPALWIGLAASALLAVGLFFAFQKEEAPAIARVDSGSAGELNPGDELRSGAQIRTSKGGRLTIVFLSDATRVTVRGESEVRIAEKRVTLSRGALDATVAPQPKDAPLVFATPNAEAKIVGTRISLSATADATRLEVREGKVRLSRKEGAESVDVARDQFAVVAKDVPLEARALTLLTGSAFVAQMAPNSWRAVPDSALRPVTPGAARNPRIQGNMGARGIMESWSGGALDSQRTRLIVWGGGATNYRGNEVYAFDLLTLRWERLTDPSPEPADGKDANPDGTPNARDTFNGLAYLAHLDRFFALGGSLSGFPPRTGADTPWLFDVESKRWTGLRATGAAPRTAEGDSCAYDPIARKVWYFATPNASGWGLFSLDLDSGRWTKHSDDHMASHTVAIDPKKGLLVTVGAGDVSAYDLRGATARQVWKTTGADAFIAKHGVGFDFDAPRDRFLGWAGGAVYSLDPSTRIWTAIDAPGAPAPTPNGIYGRWRYVPALDVFVVATTIDDNVFFYKPGK